MARSRSLVLSSNPAKAVVFPAVLSTYRGGLEYAPTKLNGSKPGTHFAYEAARPSRDRASAGFVSWNPDGARAQRDAVAMMFEARDLAENVGFVKGHLRKVQLYGAGTLTYEPNTGNPGMDSEISAYLAEWADVAHTGLEHNFTRLIQLALMGMVRDRDSLLIFQRDEDMLRLQLAEADQIGELYSYTNPRPDYVSGVFRNTDGTRAGYKVYERLGEMQYANPQFVEAKDALFFCDPMRNSVRGITAYDTSITNIRDKFEILGYEKVIVKEISTTGVVTYTQRGQADAFDYDQRRQNADGSVTFIQHKESGTREYMGLGEKFEVVPHNRPSETFRGFLKMLDSENCQGLNLPYGFVVDPSGPGGVAARIIAHIANREFERMQRDVLLPNLRKIRTIILGDAIERGKISRHPKFAEGLWMFPPPPTADIQRESDISIRETRAGLSTYTHEYAIYGQNRKKQWRIKMEEAVERHQLAWEATKQLAAMGVENVTVSPDEIAAMSDNPVQPGNGEQPAKQETPEPDKPTLKPEITTQPEDQKEPALRVGDIDTVNKVVARIESGKLKPDAAAKLCADILGISEARAQKIINLYLSNDAPTDEQMLNLALKGEVTQFKSETLGGHWITVEHEHIFIKNGDKRPIGEIIHAHTHPPAQKPHEAAFEKAHPVIRGDHDANLESSAVAHFNEKKRGLKLHKNGQHIGGIVPANSGEIAAGSKPFKLVDFSGEAVNGHMPDLRFDSLEEAVHQAHQRGFQFPDVAAKPASAPKEEPKPAPSAPKVERKNPVSETVIMKAQGATAEAGNRALAAIDRVHDTGGNLARGTFVEGRKSKREEGHYDPNTGEVSVSANAPHPETTAVHELGHKLHDQEFGFTGFSDDELKTPLGKQIKPYVDAVKKTASHKELAGALRRNKGKANGVADHIKYIADPKEIFARDYSHYIALRGGDEKMLEHIKKERADTFHFGHLSYRSDEEMQKVADGLDQVFKNKGWL